MTVRMRHTRSHTNNRRSHHALENPTLSKDNSGTPHLRHRMNPATGMYRGRKVVDMAARASKKAGASKAEGR